jgi:hypothetical protein
MEFEEKLKDASLGEDDFLMSFDVRALYPNVSFQLLRSY